MQLLQFLIFLKFRTARFRHIKYKNLNTLYFRQNGIKIVFVFSVTKRNRCFFRLPPLCLCWMDYLVIDYSLTVNHIPCVLYLLSLLWMLLKYTGSILLNIIKNQV